VLQIVSSALMRALRRLLAALAVGSGVVGCPPVPLAPKPAQDLQVTGGVPGAVVDLSSIRWQPGVEAYELPVTGQATRSVVVWVPEAAEPRALVILLHGTVHPGKRQEPAARLRPSRVLVSCLAAPALGFLDPLIIAPSSPTGQWWTPSDTEFVLGLVLAARSRWPAK